MKTLNTMLIRPLVLIGALCSAVPVFATPIYGSDLPNHPVLSASAISRIFSTMGFNWPYRSSDFVSTYVEPNITMEWIQSGIVDEKSIHVIFSSGPDPVQSVRTDPEIISVMPDVVALGPTVTTESVAEPGILALFALGIAGLIYKRRDGQLSA